VTFKKNEEIIVLLDKIVSKLQRENLEVKIWEFHNLMPHNKNIEVRYGSAIYTVNLYSKVARENITECRLKIYIPGQLEQDWLVDAKYIISGNSMEITSLWGTYLQNINTLKDFIPAVKGAQQQHSGLSFPGDK
jgi:hypothetical protein